MEIPAIINIIGWIILIILTIYFMFFYKKNRKHTHSWKLIDKKDQGLYQSINYYCKCGATKLQKLYPFYKEHSIIIENDKIEECDHEFYQDT